MVLTRKSGKNKKEKLMMSELGLPEEVVLSRILPLLSMKDVARSSVVSHGWLRYWRNTPILSFQDPGFGATNLAGCRDFSTYYRVISDVRTRFVTWVDSILSNHKGCKLDEFKLVYYLDNSHQLIIDKWLVWAFSKHVQRLILDFTPPCVTYACHPPEEHFYPLSHRTLVSVTTPYLTTLCLTSVNVDAPTLHYLLHACASTLEDLSIVSSQCLTSIAALQLPSLKSFILVGCPRLEIIDIQAPKLVSLTYNAAWYAVLRVFNVSNSSLLSYADISAKDEQHFLFIFRSLFKCFPHLEHLKLNWIANLDMDLVLGDFPVLANLKHLEMFPKKASVRTLAAWVPFIGACPRLEKLTLGIGNWLLARAPTNMYREKCPLRYLKTFEIRSFHGRNLDVDIANFVVQNGISLQEVIVHLSCNPNRSLNLEAPFADLDFELPSHVKLVIVK